MLGKYLRQIEEGEPRDPTMTYMEDPWAVDLGHYLRDQEGYHEVVRLDGYTDSPHVRFAHLRCNVIPVANVTVHDLREEDKR